MKIEKKAKKLLGVEIRPENLASVLEKVHKCISNKCVFCHIVSINPEILVLAQDDVKYRNILSEGDIQICDGVGVALGGSILGVEVGERLTGSDLMEEILKNQSQKGLHVLLLGGKSDIAERLSVCYQKKFPSLSFKGIQGISDISDPKNEEEERIFSIVADYKPQIIFVAFGSPWQEKWIWQHRKLLEGAVCMGVGGGFDFALGVVSRAPKFMRSIGFEWLYRLIVEPWRLGRQLRLIVFIWLVILKKVGLYSR